MSVDFTWMKKHQCSRLSPELRIDGIPPNTTEISVSMIDHDMRSFDHGGGFIISETGFPQTFSVTEGALKSYKGPCPPDFHSFGHDYEFIVVARDKANNSLAQGQKKRTFSAKEVPQ